MLALLNSPRDLTTYSTLVSEEDKQKHPEKYVPAIAIAVGILAHEQFRSLNDQERTYLQAFLGESQEQIELHLKRHPEGFKSPFLYETSLETIVNSYTENPEKCKFLITFIRESFLCLVVANKTCQVESKNFRFARLVILTEYQSPESLIHDKELSEMQSEKLMYFDEKRNLDIPYKLPIIAISKAAWEVLQNLELKYFPPAPLKKPKKACLLQ